MIYGEIETQENYCDFYAELLEFIKAHFNNVESGLQGDAYIWISAGSEKVSLDTFTSMNFEIKANALSSTLVELVIETIQKQYIVRRYGEPILEAFDDVDS